MPTKLLQEGAVTSAQVKMFYNGAQTFYIWAVEYALDNLSLKENLLKNARFVHSQSKESATFSRVEYFVKR